MLSSHRGAKQATIFGINLENGRPGLVYHSIGVNGAKFKHYLAAGLFVDQTAALAPDLVILSLGTNEALDYPYFDPQFVNQMDSLITRLRTKNPNARILLTTPPDSYRRKTRRNPGVEIIGNKNHNLRRPPQPCLLGFIPGWRGQPFSRPLEKEQAYAV